MRRRAALLAGIAVLGAGVLAAAAPADNPTPPPGFQATVQACAAKGLKQGTDAFAQCVNAQLGGSAPPPGAGAQLQAAQAACRAQGLTQGTRPFAQCVQQQLDAGKPPTTTGPAPPQAPAPASAAGKAAQQCIAQGAKPGSAELGACVQRMLLTPKRRQAYDTCVAQGKSAGQALADCVDALLGAASNPALTPRQKDDVDYCLGLGKVQGTQDFAACIRTAGNRNLTPAQQAAVDQCQKQGLAGTALAKCVGGLLTVKVPGKPPAAGGPTPAAVQAAFGACIGQKLRPRTDAFQACVTARLKGP